MANFLRDTSFALRMLRKRWGVTLVVVVSLAVAIGGNTAVFSLVSAILLQPSSVVEPERVVLVQERLKAQSINVSTFTVSPGTWADFQERSRTAQSFAAFRVSQRGLRGSESTEPIMVSEVTPGFFDLVGEPLLRGRGFQAEEGIEGAAKVAVIRTEFWEREYGGEGNPLGEVLILDGEPHEVVGVLPTGFSVLLTASDIWVPLLEAPGLLPRDRRDLVPLARLAPDATIEAFEGEVAALAQQLESEHPEYFEGWTLDVFNYRYDIPSMQAKMFYALLQGSVLFVLLIACANVTNLLLARGQERRQEIALRLTLGASRLRIVRQLLTESTLLVAAGMLLGIGLGRYGIHLMVNYLAGVLPPTFVIALDGQVLVFTLIISAVTGLVFGMVPAVQASRRCHAEEVNSGGGRSSASRSRKRVSRALVVAEIALSLVALGGGGVLIQSFLQMRGGDPGFDPSPIFTARVRVPESKYPTDEETLLLLEKVLERARSVEGVAEAALVNSLPRTFDSPTEAFQVRGREREEGSQAPQAFALRASPEYIDTFGIELVQGRFFDAADRVGQAPVAVINRSFAETWLGGESPLGLYVEVRGEPRRIVGVVEDVQQVLLQTASSVQSEAIYTPMAQAPTRSLFVTLRSRGGDPGLLAEPLRGALRDLDPDLTFSQLLTMEDVTARSFVGMDIFTTILGGFGVLALLLAAVGNYGVLAYSVNQRRNEIGIRIAMGAEGKSIVWMVARQGIWLAVAGLGLGSLFMFPLLGLIRSLMEGFASVSGGISVAAGALLFSVTVAASLVPAYRAARVNPVGALHQE